MQICDDTNQAKGFAAVGTSDGFGRLSVSFYCSAKLISNCKRSCLCSSHFRSSHTQGSVIGGYLAQPASKFGPLKKPFFCKYPYSLPCIVGAALAVISFIGNENIS